MRVSGADRMNKTFENPWPHDSHGFADILRWKLGMGEREQARLPDAPGLGAPSMKPDLALIASPPTSGWYVTWLGHSSFLLQGCGKSFLIDPVFSEHCSPLPIPSLRRKVAPPCRVSGLPHIDAILLTHSHYDHMDLPTLRKLGKNIPLFTPSGHAGMLGKKGFTSVTEIPWWQSVEVFPDVKITAVPAQHFTARTPFDKNLAHWCGWVIEGDGKRLWHAGDSGYCPAFSEIGKRFGGIDLAMVPIGAYQPRHIMRAMHMNPDEAVQAFLDAECRAAVAMHWGTFRLTDEPMGEPPLLLERAVEREKLPSGAFVAVKVGETRRI